MLLSCSPLWQKFIVAAEVGRGALQSRHAVVTFATQAHLVYNLNNGTVNANYAALRPATEAVPYTRGLTLLSDGLQRVIDDIDGAPKPAPPWSPSWSLS